MKSNVTIRDRALLVLFGSHDFPHANAHDDDDRGYGHPFKEGSERVSVNDIIDELNAGAIYE
jgi:hypothetical protein